MGKSNKKTRHDFFDDADDYEWKDDFDKNWKKEEEVRQLKRLQKYEILEVNEPRR